MEKKSFEEDICRIVGHNWVEEVTPSDDPIRLTYYLDGRKICERCGKKKKARVQIKYSEMFRQKSAILNRAKERLKLFLDNDQEK